MTEVSEAAPAESRDELETAISEALTRAWCMAVTYAAANLVSEGVPLGYPEAAPETAKLLTAVDAWSGRCAAQQPKLAPGNAEVAYEQWIEQRNPDDVGSMAGFVAGWQVAITAASGWPLCPNGCGCRLGTEDADARDCACDGLCCYDEIEVSELFAERDRLRKELHERDAQLADALTPAAGDFEHAAEIMRLRGISPTAWTTASPLSLTAPPPGPTPVEAVRTAVAEEWQPRVDALRDTVRELLDCTGLDDGEKAEWLERAGIDLEDE